MKTNRLNQTVLLPALAALLGAGGAFATHFREAATSPRVDIDYYDAEASCQTVTCGDYDTELCSVQYGSARLKEQSDCDGAFVTPIGNVRP